MSEQKCWHRSKKICWYYPQDCLKNWMRGATEVEQSPSEDDYEEETTRIRTI